MTVHYHAKNVSEVHHFFGLSKPLHPLITVIKKWPVVDCDFANSKVSCELYIIAMKGNLKGIMQYGRNTYDYEEGTMVFTAPNQVITFDKAEVNADYSGWTIFFHPDLIRKSELGRTIKNFAFFDYSVHEALHNSDKEKQILYGFVEQIEIELNQNIDNHSQELIITNLQSLLKYSHRYYDRQFCTRAIINKDYITKFENYLEINFASIQSMNKGGVPTVSQCGEALNMSPRYLSDLLKTETGMSAKEHIYYFIIEKAKTLLLSSEASVSEVAYILGFEYPQHFSKLFKTKTGLNPTDYRTVN